MASMPMDPYKVLDLPKNFTAEQLKQNYKRLVLRYHPDRNVEKMKSTPIFQTLTFCYNYLANELRSRDQGKEHHELKRQYDTVEKGMQNVSLDSKSFNVKKFNTLFEQNKYKDESIEEGYDDWFKSDKVEDKGAIINYSEPEPLFMGASKLGNLYEFGKGNVDDYSGTNMSNKNLNYMDLKKAYTTSQIEDEKYVEKRREYKSVEEAKKHRAEVSFVMNEQELRDYNRRKEEERKREELRLQKVKNENTLIDQLYQKTNKIMLGFFGKGS